MKVNQLNGWLKENLVCPRDHNKLMQLKENILVCPMGHTYPIIDGIPIMLLEDKVPTQPAIFNATLDKVKSYQITPEYNLDENKSRLSPHVIDSYVQEVIGATCGIMYRPLISRLSRYPIPNLPLAKRDGKYFLEVGCNWGRWCISAAKLGYNPIGIDHNLDAIRAACRVTQQLGVKADYLVADARYLPFSENIFDVVFSYSVLQHFDKIDAKFCLSEISRTLKISGICLVQMPNIFGLRNLYNQFKRGFRQPMDFEVRYWLPLELVRTFTNFIGSTSFSVDGFFSLNPQALYKDLLPFWYRFAISCSNRLQRMSEKIPWLKYCADSLYIKSIKQ